MPLLGRGVRFTALPTPNILTLQSFNLTSPSSIEGVGLNSGAPLFHVEIEIPCAKGIGRHLLSGDEAWRGSDQIGDAVDDGRTS